MTLRLRAGALRGRGGAAGADVHTDLALKAAVKAFPGEQQGLFEMSEMFCIFTEKEIFLRLNYTP